MATSRFVPPVVGPPTPVRFPDVTHDALGNGVTVRAVSQNAVPAVTISLVVAGGTSADPVDRPGLASLVATLMHEGAGGRDAIELSDALARLGSHLDVESAPDVTVVSLTTLTRHFRAALAIVADVVQRPHLLPEDFARVRDLRRSRLKQTSQSPGAAADRGFLAAVFGDHPYGHGTLGTTRALEEASLEEARNFWMTAWTPDRATLVVVGDVTPADAVAAAREAFGAWTAPARAAAPLAAPPASRDRRILVVDRPGAPQSELRVGHTGPPRRTPLYHALVTLNAALGGQFTSRINRNLRETRGITYGARTSFDMRRMGGTFSCDTSVQGNATAEAVQEVLREIAGIRADEAIGADELAHAKDSLTRGYVRHFETAPQVARAVTLLVTHELDPDTYDRFVPAVEALTADDLAGAAQGSLRPDEATVVIAGDLEKLREPLEALGRAVEQIEPEF